MKIHPSMINLRFRNWPETPSIKEGSLGQPKFGLNGAQEVETVSAALRWQRPETVNPTKRDPWVQKLSDMEARKARLDALLTEAINGREFSTRELLALQHGVCRYSEELQIISQVAAKSVSAIKQVLSSQS